MDTTPARCGGCRKAALRSGSSNVFMENLGLSSLGGGCLYTRRFSAEDEKRGALYR